MQVNKEGWNCVRTCECVGVSLPCDGRTTAPMQTTRTTNEERTINMLGKEGQDRERQMLAWCASTTLRLHWGGNTTHR
jgi:hypothetical protein